MYRIYCELKLNLKIKPKKRLAPPRTAIKLQQPDGINQCWSLDYMSDALVNERRIRTANIIDDYHRGGLGGLFRRDRTSHLKKREFPVLIEVQKL